MTNTYNLPITLTDLKPGTHVRVVREPVELASPSPTVEVVDVDPGRGIAKLRVIGITGVLMPAVRFHKRGSTFWVPLTSISTEA